MYFFAKNKKLKKLIIKKYKKTKKNNFKNIGFSFINKGKSRNVRILKKFKI